MRGEKAALSHCPTLPKPKWMRWRTYHRLVERFERYEAALDVGALSRVKRLLRRS